MASCRHHHARARWCDRQSRPLPRTICTVVRPQARQLGWQPMQRVSRRSASRRSPS